MSEEENSISKDNVLKSSQSDASVGVPTDKVQSRLLKLASGEEEEEDESHLPPGVRKKNRCNSSSSSDSEDEADRKKDKKDHSDDSDSALSDDEKKEKEKTKSAADDTEETNKKAKAKSSSRSRSRSPQSKRRRSSERNGKKSRSRSRSRDRKHHRREKRRRRSSSTSRRRSSRDRDHHRRKRRDRSRERKHRRSSRSHSRDRKRDRSHSRDRKKDRSHSRDRRRSRSRDRREKRRGGGRDHRGSSRRSKDRKTHSRSKSRSKSPAKVIKIGDKVIKAGASFGRPPSSSKPLTFKEKMRQQFIKAMEEGGDATNALTDKDGVVMCTQSAGIMQAVQQQTPAAPKPPIKAPVPLMANLVQGTASLQAATVSANEAAMQSMLQLQKETEERTGVEIPKYYNPAAINPVKYAEQVQKRKLLWSKTKDKDVNSQWNATNLSGEHDDKSKEKFRKLMGIKHGEAGTSGGQGASGDESTEDQQKELKQRELFDKLDKEYQFARMTTHTHRGVGLGFGSMAGYQPPPPPS